MQSRNSNLELVSPARSRKSSGKVRESDAAAGRNTVVWTFGEFELDLATERLRLRGETVLLRNRPFQVLVYLIERRDRLVEQSELLEAIWGGAPVYHDALRKAVGSIRAALGDNSQTPAYIETHWGRGYRFIGDVSVQDAEEPNPSSLDDDSLETPFVLQGAMNTEAAAARSGRVMPWSLASIGLALLLLAGASAAIGRHRLPAAASEEAGVIDPARTAWSEPHLDDYREAQFLLSQRNAQSIQAAIEIFNRLVATNSQTGDAYAGLAECYALGYWQFWKTDPALAAARSAEYARKAVEANPKSAYAHAQLAASYVRAWRVRDAQLEFERSLALRPEDAEVHHAYAVFLDDTRRAEQGIREMQRAIELQPLSLAYKTDLGMSYFFARRFPEAIATYKAVLKLDPHYAEAHEYLASMYVFEGRWSEAKTEYATVDRLRGTGTGDRPYTALRLLTMLHTGEQAKARAGIEAIRSSPTTENAYDLADISAQTGRTEEALQSLRRLVDARSPGAFSLYSDPLLDPLRGNAEFEALAEKVLDAGGVRETAVSRETTTLAQALPDLTAMRR